MLPIPPLASAAHAAGQVRQSQEKIQQMQRVQDRAKESAPAGDRFEHAVESSEEIQPIHDQDERNQQQKNQGGKRRTPIDEADDSDSHLDLKA